jgi:hypothetical protein
MLGASRPIYLTRQVWLLVATSIVAPSRILVTNAVARGVFGGKQYAPGKDRSITGVGGRMSNVAVELGKGVWVGPGVDVFGIAAMVCTASVSGGAISTGAGTQLARNSKMSRKDSHFMIDSPNNHAFCNSQSLL